MLIQPVVALHPLVEMFFSKGVPVETTILLLMLPLVATLIAFLRQAIGVKAFGIYTPTIVIFAFLYIGIKYAVAIFVSIIFVGMITRVLLKHLRLLYLSRVAITITIVSLSILAVLVTGGNFQRTGLASVSIFPLLIIITIVEKFVATQIEKGTRTALSLAAETLVIALIGYFIVSRQFTINFIAAYPWAILLTLPINILLGKWTGLRLTEYFRFREILKKM